jgi:hypothetical protein
LKKLAGRSSWVQGRKGITADLNGIYFVPVSDKNKATRRVKITTRPEAGKTNIGNARNFWIEPDLLYPLIKGASDFEACYLHPDHDLFTLVPNKGITREYGERAEDKMKNLTDTKKYFRAYETRLRARSTWSKRMPKMPFYSVYNVGAYSFAPFKVIWAEQSGEFAAAVAGSAEVPLVGERPYVPDHKIFFVDFDEERPAYFLCGLLTSSMVKEFVESHNISIQVGDIFKHMNVPPYETKNQAHKDLASLVKQAHGEDDENKRAKLVDRIRAAADKILADAKK